MCEAHVLFMSICGAGIGLFLSVLFTCFFVARLLGSDGSDHAAVSCRFHRNPMAWISSTKLRVLSSYLPHSDLALHNACDEGI